MNPSPITIPPRCRALRVTVVFPFVVLLVVLALPLLAVAWGCFFAYQLARAAGEEILIPLLMRLNDWVEGGRV